MLCLLCEGCCKYGWLVVLMVYDLNFVCCFVMYVLLMDGEGYIIVGIVVDVFIFEYCVCVLCMLIVEVVDGCCMVLIFDDFDDD